MQIRPFAVEDEEGVIRLWEICGLLRPWNDPRRDIARKLTEQPELFLVGERDGAIVASVMAGFDGHRGWVNYLAVHPDHRGRSFGRALMRTVEQGLTQRGCPKVNLQIRSTNRDVIAFYKALGYVEDDVICMGRRLIADN
jgi:ribosomal protein S18 acetylase RimI-like enzyme